MKNNWQLKELIKYEPGSIISRQLVGDRGLNSTLFSMSAGTSISTHTTQGEAWVQVLEGEGEFILGEEKIKMEPGRLIKMDSGEQHSLKATAPTAFLLFINK